MSQPKPPGDMALAQAMRVHDGASIIASFTGTTLFGSSLASVLTLGQGESVAVNDDDDGNGVKSENESDGDGDGDGAEDGDGDTEAASDEDASGVRASDEDEDTDGEPEELSCKLGYGDFYFGRRSQDKSIDWKLSKEDMMIDSYNLPETHYGGFQRSGPFPFTKLPELVRKQIFENLVGHFTCNAEGAIRIFICELGEAAPNKEEIHRLHTKPYAESDFCPHPSRTISRYNCKISDSRRAYYMTVLTAKRGATRNAFRGKDQDWLLKDLPRHITNVSKQFRSEFAQIFWKNTRIYCEADVHSCELLNFLADRKSIFAGIKSLRVAQNQPWLGDDGDAKYGDAYRRFCKFVSDNLKLESFHLEISYAASELQGLLEGTGDLDFLKATRDIVVTGTFALELEPDCAADASDFTERMDLEEEWNEKHAVDIEKHICPRGLLPAPDPEVETEEEKYRLTRSLLVPESGVRKHAANDFDQGRSLGFCDFLYRQWRKY